MEKPAKCQGCPLFSAPGPVLPSMPDDEFGYVVVGEAPGASEVAEGKPFVGASGKKLRVMLARSGIRPSSCAFTNVVWCRPNGNETPSQEAISFCSERYLKPWLEEHAKGKKLLIVGSVASELLLGEKITNCAGYTFTNVYGSAVAVPVLHPAAVLRNPSSEPFAQRCIAKLSVATAPYDYSKNIRPHPTYSELEDFVARVLTGDRFAFDFETKGLNDPRPVSLAITAQTGETVVTAWDNKVANIVKPLFFAEHLLKIGYNIRYDAAVVEHVYGEPPNGNWADVMRIAQLADLETTGMSLEAVAPVVLNVPSWKHKINTEGLYIYNAKDALYTFLIYETLAAKRGGMPEWKLWERTKDLEFVAYEMERKGIAVNLEEMAAAKNRASERLEQCKKEWASLAPGVNPLSPKQVQAFMVANGFKVWKTNEGKETTQQAYLELAVAHQPKFKPYVDLLLEIRKHMRFLSTYTEYIPDVDGRFRFRMNLISSNVSPTLPDDKSFFVAGSGMVLMKADMAQLEPRIVAALAGNKQLLEAEDLHAYMAERLFGQATEHNRKLAKAVIYNIGYRKVSEQTGLPFSEAGMLVTRFAKEFDDYWGMIEQWKLSADRNGVLKNPFGRIRSFWGENTAAQSRLWMQRSTANDVMFLLMCKLHEPLKALGAHLLLKVHNELLIEAPEESVKDVAIVVKGLAESEWPELKGARFKCKLTAGKRWSEL